jgi:hypothetical protein
MGVVVAHYGVEGSGFYGIGAIAVVAVVFGLGRRSPTVKPRPVEEDPAPIPARA